MDEHIFMFHVLDMQPKKLIDNVFQWPDGLKSAELCAQIQDQDWEKSFLSRWYIQLYSAPSTFSF